MSLKLPLATVTEVKSAVILEENEKAYSKLCT